MCASAAQSPNPLGLIGFLHFSFTVRDLERSVAFYRDIMDMEVFVSKAAGCPTPVREEKQTYVAGVTGYPDAHLKIALLRRDGVMLELIEYVQPQGDPHEPGTHRPGSPHIAFTVADIDRAWHYLQRIGDQWSLVFASRGPTLVNTGQNAGGRAFYFRDPDGITIELVELNHAWLLAGSVAG